MHGPYPHPLSLPRPPCSLCAALGLSLWQLVLAADVLYQPGEAQLMAFATALAPLVRPNVHRPEGARLLLVHKRRHACLDERIANALFESSGLILLESIPLDQQHPDYRSPVISVLVYGAAGDDQARPLQGDPLAASLDISLSRGVLATALSCKVCHK